MLASKGSRMEAYGEDFSRVYNEKWDLWARKVWPFLTKTVRDRKIRPGRWLDLCCGTGGLLQLATAQGFEAVGVDNSVHQLRHARKKAPGASLVQCDAQDFTTPRTFDVVTCIFDSVNYLTGVRQLRRLLARTSRHLKSTGVFVFDIKTVHGFKGEHTRILHDARRTIIFESSYDEDQRMHRFYVTGFVKRGKLYAKFQEVHVQRAYSAEEIESELRAAGFKFCVKDGETFGRPRRSSRRLIYVCSKVA